MTETQQRFLRAIAERVPSEQVVEVHLFPPIRQGGVETGVAVVAEDPRRAAPETDPVILIDAMTIPEQEDTPVESASTETDVDGDAPIHDGEMDGTVDAQLADESFIDTDDPFSDGAQPLSRYTIHTARYRLTLKGVDRGKWEVDVVAEADAPLDAVDAVVRGVQRRAGEVSEPDRLSTEAFREALDLPLAQLER